MKNILFILLISLFLTSCAFNNAFLNPEEIDQNLETVHVKELSDTLKATVEKENFQPTFLDENDNILSTDYTVKSVVFKSSSGNNLNGWIIKSKEIPFNGISLLHFHGNSGFIYNQHQRIIPLLKYGFQIFVFDYSGFGFSEGESIRKNVIKDGISALSYVKNHKEFKNSEIIIYGHSLGGNLAATIAAEVENDISGVVIEGAFSTHKDIASEFARIFGKILVKENSNALKEIKKFHKPVLVIHSTEDQVVPYHLGKKIYDAANEPKELFTIKKPHMRGPEFYGKDISDKIIEMTKQK